MQGRWYPDPIVVNAHPLLKDHDAAIDTIANFLGSESCGINTDYTKGRLNLYVNAIYVIYNGSPPDDINQLTSELIRGVMLCEFSGQVSTLHVICSLDKGNGSYMMRELGDRCTGLGVTDIMLDPLADAIKFYKRTGFNPEELINQRRVTRSERKRWFDDHDVGGLDQRMLLWSAPFKGGRRRRTRRVKRSHRRTRGRRVQSRRSRS